MLNYVGGHRADTPHDFFELALGAPVDLWLGVEGESEEERAARLDAACDIITDPEFYDLPARVIHHDPELFNVVALPRLPRRRPVRRRAAA
ncbi:hypothetical protein AQI88_24135 [Streptomyces cellostaticus]|uniref:Uncharacterized protein n=1 Tax=Streptomyces cellostaticus TaxID=67285 RepID=A0A117PV65_9ACTN|nr:hypothetical protein [Streptomyces cellostaticus]KUM93843.1 hypothetical protein AQI88_24135 [Streptomyces cellostaticus]GHI04987.1 hypothetical protein Scel_33080 [Streptomyces cellostaticus]